MNLCIFCEIADKKKQADIVYENDEFIVLNDINPKAPVHLLLLPKRHINSVNEINDNDKDLMWELFSLAKRMAEEKNTKEGYKLAFNIGRKGGQVIDHLHLHLLGGY